MNVRERRSKRAKRIRGEAWSQVTRDVLYVTVSGGAHRQLERRARQSRRRRCVANSNAPSTSAALGQPSRSIEDAPHLQPPPPKYGFTIGTHMPGSPLTEVQRNNGTWFYRRSIPLSAFRAECALCHSNFVGLDATDWVGALMLKVPIEQD